MSPPPDSNSGESPHFSNNDSDGIQSDHPDAPLSIEPYLDDPLAEYEPRPIAADDYDEYESVRPRSKWAFFWLRNKGMFLVLMAQMFGASMNVMTKILEMYSSMHPFQVSFFFFFFFFFFLRKKEFELQYQSYWNCILHINPI